MGVRRAWTHVWVAMGFIGRGGGSWRQLDLGATDCSPRNAARGHVRGGVESAARSAGDNDDSAIDRKSTRLNSSHVAISYAVFCLKKKSNACNAIRSIA